MAMLAERKSKVKWSLNPRGNYWSQDTNKFGHRMLEKMGWKPGSGLGANEQGITEHVKVKYKSDNKCIGFEEKTEKWVEQQSHFESFLAELNDCHDVKVSSVEQSEQQSESLELRSQQSRARVHYQKFMRGKDLSSRSKKDLACIIGVKRTAENVDNGVEKQDNMDTSYGVTTISRGSINDYFTKMKHKSASNLTDSYVIREDEEVCSEFPEGDTRKKRKKGHDHSESEVRIYDQEDEELCSEFPEGETRKKRKKGQDHSETEVRIDGQETPNVRMKKEKGKKEKQNCANGEIIFSEEQSTICNETDSYIGNNSDDILSKPHGKRKKKAQEVEEQSQEKLQDSDSILLDEKKMKFKKHKQEIDENASISIPESNLKIQNDKKIVSKKSIKNESFNMQQSRETSDEDLKQRKTVKNKPNIEIEEKKEEIERQLEVAEEENLKQRKKIRKETCVENEEKMQLQMNGEENFKERKKMKKETCVENEEEMELQAEGEENFKERKKTKKKKPQDEEELKTQLEMSSKDLKQRKKTSVVKEYEIDGQEMADMCVSKKNNRKKNKTECVENEEITQEHKSLSSIGEKVEPLQNVDQSKTDEVNCEKSLDVSCDIRESSSKSKIVVEKEKRTLENNTGEVDGQQCHTENAMTNKTGTNLKESGNKGSIESTNKITKNNLNESSKFSCKRGPFNSNIRNRNIQRCSNLRSHNQSSYNSSRNHPNESLKKMKYNEFRRLVNPVDIKFRGSNIQKIMGYGNY